MRPIELKFLLKLLGFTGYEAPLSQIEPNPNTRTRERDKVCRALRDRGLLECDYEIVKIRLAPPGKALLKLDPQNLPLTKQELKILRACEAGEISPGKTRVPPAQRAEIIPNLTERGLVKIHQRIKTVRLTQEGKVWLRDQYVPTNAQASVNLSFGLLKNYLQFLHQFGPTEASSGAISPHKVDAQALTEGEILQAIRETDDIQGTENYLPIFYLREKLQPPLARTDLDQWLYQLQRQDKIELSSLQESVAYTSEQIGAGIPQEIGGPLFFITVTTGQ